jgi:hypothetical protein
MIQDIAPKMMYNQFRKREETVPVPEDTVFCFEGNKILCARNEDGELYFPSFREAEESGIGERDVQYLFAIDTHRYYLYKDYGKHRKERLEGESPIPGYGYEIYRILRELLPKTETVAGPAADLEQVSAESGETARLLQPGDVLDFLCDYYRYDGSYDNTYMLGEQLVIGADGAYVIANAELPEDGSLRLTYRFTDLYQQHYWTESLEI